MHRCSFVYKKVPYSSVKQGYHHLHAQYEEEPDIAQSIMTIHDPVAIKELSKSLPKSEGWAKIAPDKMWDLNLAKYDQNPELKKQLLDTAPDLLIEASIDSKWGGGLAPSVPIFITKAKYLVPTCVGFNSPNIEITFCQIWLHIQCPRSPYTSPW